MTRCAPDRWLVAARRGRRRHLFALAVLGLLCAPAAAQLHPGHRVFPANALRGELVVTAPPEVLLNGKADRLAPGARIRSEDNQLVMSGAIAGQRLVVHYTREVGTGLLRDVWVLRPIERDNRPWPGTELEAQRWTFDPAAQTWKRP